MSRYQKTPEPLAASDQSLLEVNHLESGQMGRLKNLSDFDQEETVMAGRPGRKSSLVLWGVPVHHSQYLTQAVQARVRVRVMANATEQFLWHK